MTKQEEFTNKESSKIIIIAYFIVMYVLSSICLIFLSNIFSTSDFSAQLIQDSLSKQTIVPLDITNKVLIIGNFIPYIVIFAIVVYCGRIYFKQDAKELKNKKLFYTIFGLCSAVIFYFVGKGADALSAVITNNQVSNNQESIVNSLKSNLAFLQIIVIVFIAPIVEEMVFRKSIYKIVDKTAPAFIISTLLFTLIHMVSSFNILANNPKIFFGMTLPYIVAAIMLNAIYVLSKKNIYINIFVHIVNNFIALLAAYNVFSLLIK